MNVSENHILPNTLIVDAANILNRRITTPEDKTATLDNNSSQTTTLAGHKDTMELKNLNLGSVIRTINILKPDEDELPLIATKTESLGNGKELKRYTNAYGLTITEMNTAKDRTMYQVNIDNVGIILTNNYKGKYDTLCFSDMGDKVPKNSMIPNVYYHATGENTVSKIYFDKNHDVVIKLRTGDMLVLNGKDPLTVKEGDFDIKKSPNSDGKGFKVDYSGDGKLKKFTSFGDKVVF